MIIYYAGGSEKHKESFCIKMKCNRLFSYIDLIDNTRAFGVEDRFKEFIKGKIKNENPSRNLVRR